MKVLMFEFEGRRRLGALRPGDEATVVDLSSIVPDMLGLIDAGDAGLSQARRAASNPSGAVHALDEVRLLPPLDPPRGNIIAIGRNYQKHAQETAGSGTAA